MPVYVLVLNYNGRKLLAECLPSVLRAAESASHNCRVAVIDNASTDDSADWLAREFPEVEVIARPNRGLASFNDVLADVDGQAAVLLNNDVKLAADSIDPLISPLVGPHRDEDCFLTAALCWNFDGSRYDGQKTAIRWRMGLVQATSLYPGHEQHIHRPGLTASAGAVIAVDRAKFLALGGFDPLYFPGRLEDLDFAFRGHAAGWHARHVPESVAWHVGSATFRAALGDDASHGLALRNTLLFQWKNLRHPAHLARQLLGLPLRAACDLLRAPLVPPAQRFAFLRALGAAILRVRQLRRGAFHARSNRQAEREFFRHFHPKQIDRLPLAPQVTSPKKSAAAPPRSRRKLAAATMAGSAPR